MEQALLFPWLLGTTDNVNYAESMWTGHKTKWLSRDRKQHK